MELVDVFLVGSIKLSDMNKIKIQLNIDILRCSYLLSHFFELLFNLLEYFYSNIK